MDNYISILNLNDVFVCPSPPPALTTLPIASTINEEDNTNHTAAPTPSPTSLPSPAPTPVPVFAPMPKLPFEGEIQFALTLNFKATPRLHCSKQKMQIQRAACCLVSYDYGYIEPFAVSQIQRWERSVNTAISSGPPPSSFTSAPTVTPLATKHKGSVSYIAQLETNHPGYLRTLFRYAQRVKGALAALHELATTVNEKSTTHPNKPATTINRIQLNDWFIKEGGKKSAPTTKPLDEKWFYITNRRRRIKRLPRGDDEEEGADYIPQPKVRNRRFPIKAMYMGVVGRHCVGMTLMISPSKFAIAEVIQLRKMSTAIVNTCSLRWTAWARPSETRITGSLAQRSATY